MLFIVNDPIKSGGVYTWWKFFSKTLDDLHYTHTSVFNKIPHTTDFGNSNEILVNNYLKTNFWNKDILEYIITTKKNKLFIVVHSKICPSNSVINPFIKYITGFVCVSTDISDKIRKLYPDKRTYVIENYVIPTLVKHNTDSTVFNLHYVGRISEEKNLPMLLGAFKDLDKNIHLHLFGEIIDKKYQMYLENFIDMYKIKDNIHFRGNVDGVEKLYEGADYTILTSAYEGVPYCVLESVACGVPVITNCIIPRIKDKCITFSFNGFDETKYDKQIDIFSYDDILLDIGYIKTFIQSLKLRDIEIAKNLGMLLNKLSGFYVVPPITIKLVGELYDKNVKLIRDKILEAKKMKFEMFEPLKKEEYIDQIQNFISRF